MTETNSWAPVACKRIRYFGSAPPRPAMGGVVGARILAFEVTVANPEFRI